MGEINASYKIMVEDHKKRKYGNKRLYYKIVLKWNPRLAKAG